MCSCGGFVLGAVMALFGIGIAVFGGVLRPEALQDVEYSDADATAELLAQASLLLCGEAADGQSLASRNPFHASCYRPASQQPNAFDASSNQYAIGRYKGPLNNFSHPPLTGGQKLAQWKEFLWSSVTDGDWLINTCLMDLGYIHVVVVGLFNRETKESYTRQIELPLVLGNYFGPHWEPDTTSRTTGVNEVPPIGPISIAHGCIRLSPLFDNSYAVSCTRQAKDGTPIRNASFFLPIHDDRDGHSLAFHVEWEYPVGSSRASDDDGPQVMSLVYPLGPRRAAMVAKGAGINSWRPSPRGGDLATPGSDDDDELPNPTISGSPSSTASRRVRFVLSGVPHELKEGSTLAAFDYTRGLLRRHSRWHWISLSVPKGRLVTDTDAGRQIHRGIGVHLSTTVYAVNNSISAENSIWKDNLLAPFEFPLNFTRVRADAHPSQTSWTITGGPLAPSDGKPVLQLDFTPYGRFQGDINYFVIYGQLTHLWGVFSGRVPTPTASGWDFVEIRTGGTPGVFEYKDAHW